MENPIAELRRLARAAAGSIDAARAGGDPHVVDLRVFEERALRLAALRELRDSVNVLASEIRQLTLRAESAHERAVENVQGHIDHVRKVAPASSRGPPPGWTALRTADIIKKGAAPPPKQWGFAPPPGAPPPRPEAEAAPVVRVQLGRGIALDAVKVTGASPAAILGQVRGGRLYFAPQWGHFAVNLGGVVLHGGLGTIYTQGRDKHPLRLLECKQGAACPSLHASDRTCGYYHDPEKCAGSRDVRNYTDASWQYVPLAAAAHPRGAPRKFGNARTLPVDLPRMGGGDVRRFHAQTMHDILCSLVLAKYGT